MEMRRSLRKTAKSILKKLFRPLQNDVVLSILVVPAAFIMLAYRRVGPGRLPKTTYRLRKIGIFPIRNHYYEPLFDDALLRTPFSDDRILPGLHLNTSGQLS